MNRIQAHMAPILAVFSNRAFTLFTAGNSVSLIGVWVHRLAVGWLAWELTESYFWLGAVSFADLFPALLIGPFAGVLADRTDRRWILIICKAFASLQGLALMVLAIYGMSIEVLFVLTLIGGTVIGVQQPARMAIVPSLVQPEHLSSAVALNSVIFNSARMVGPALAGVLIAGPGVVYAFAFVGLSHAAIMTVLVMLKLKPTKRRPPRGVLTELAEGVHYAFSHPALSPILILAIIGSVFGRPVFELLPGFADAVFDHGPGGLAILTASVGLGALLAGLWLAQRGSVRGLTGVTIQTFIATGVFSAAFAATSWFWLGALLMALAGAVTTVTGAGSQILVQTAVADEMRGRVLSFWGLTFRGGPAIGVLAMGWLADYWGAGLPVALGGIVCIAAGARMYRRRAELAAGLELEGGTAAAPGSSDQSAKASEGSTKS
jgi:MFS family permease